LKITVIGCGRWGSFIAYYLDKIGHDVTLYGMAGTPHYDTFVETRTNGLVTLREGMPLTCDMAAVLAAETVVISVNSQGLRALCHELNDAGLKNKQLVLCMKGLEIGTGLRLSQIVEENLDPSNKVAVWIGPGHVQEFVRGIPNCMVIDSKSDEVKKKLVEAFTSPVIRFYYGTDLIGNEIGAAAKNVIGIAAGMLDGFGLRSLKGALMSRGTREISRLIKAMGGNELSAYGLCHLGDYEATVFSEFSHNRRFGELFAKGETFDQLAEGYYTVKAMMSLAEQYQVELPICRSVYEILYEEKEPALALNELFGRSLKDEFYA